MKRPQGKAQKSVPCGFGNCLSVGGGDKRSGGCF